MRNEGCPRCINLEDVIFRLERRISEMEKQHSRERDETKDYDRIKNERDELRAASNRSYDRYVTDPERHRGDE